MLDDGRDGAHLPLPRSERDRGDQEAAAAAKAKRGGEEMIRVHRSAVVWRPRSSSAASPWRLQRRAGRTAAVDGAAEARGQAERRAAVARRRSSRRSRTLALGSVEPFSTQKLTVALKQEARQPNSLLAAEINRRKEPLEAYPLDSMAMVGSVVRNGRPVRAAAGRQPALSGEAGRLPRPELRKDHQDLRNRRGLREIVQDAAGEWIERTSALQLQEKAR